MPQPRAPHSYLNVLPSSSTLTTLLRHNLINRRPGSPDCSSDAYTLTVHSMSKSKAVYDPESS